MPTGKPARAEAKRAPKKDYHPPIAGDRSPTYNELREQLQPLFRGLYNAQHEVSVCQLVPERTDAPEGGNIANVLGSIVRVRIDDHLRRQAHLIRPVCGATDFDDEKIGVAPYGDTAKEKISDDR